MTTVVDLRAEDDLRDVVHRVVEAIAGGGVVELPTETEYVLAGSATDSEAVTRCRELAGQDAGRGLMFRSPGSALDYVPRIGRLGRRFLARSCDLLVVTSGPESLEGGLLTESMRSAAVTGDGLACWVPRHALLQHVLDLLPVPLFFAVPLDAERARTSGGGERDGVTLAVDDGPTRIGGAATWVGVGRTGDAEAWSILRPGVADEESLRRLTGRTFLFVCTGNTCRSPMAAALFRQRVAERLGCTIDELPEHGVFVESAGLSAGFGSPASAESVTLLAQRGVDLGGHGSQPLTDALADSAERIWTMTESHRSAVLRARPDLAERCHTLCPDGIDVADPFGGPLDEYAACLSQIEECLARIDETLTFPD